MTHEELQPILKDAGFRIVADYSKEGSHASHEKGNISLCHVDGTASVWVKGGAILLPFTDDIKKVKQVIEPQ